MEIFIIFLLLFILVIAVVAMLFNITLFFGAPYVPSRNEVLEKIIKIAEIQPGQKVADLGAGDGKVIVSLAEKGIEAHGYEINPLLVMIGKINIKRAGVRNKAFMHWGNFLRKDLSTFNVIYVYGFWHIMKRLEKKLKRTLQPNAKVVLSVFPFKNWKHKKKEGTMYLYVQDR